jgi:hypothetical protein
MSHHRTDSGPKLTDQYAISGWRGKSFGKGLWQLVPQPTTQMEMTGSAVTLDAFIPIPHRLCKFEWKHTDSSDVDNTAAVAIILSRLDQTAASVLGSPLLTQIYAEAANTSASTVIYYGEGFEYATCTYRISGNTTNGHHIYPIITIQEFW